MFSFIKDKVRVGVKMFASAFCLSCFVANMYDGNSDSKLALYENPNFKEISFNFKE